MTKVASIDIGTNTTRLLIAEIDGAQKYRKVLSERDTTRLGETFVVKREISPRAIQRTIRVLKKYADLVSENHVKETFAVATSAVREALNKDEFLAKVYKDTGLKVQVISWEEEAILTITGVFSSLYDFSSRALIIDIGGGSTECIAVNGKTPIAVHNLDLGAVYLTESFVRSDPPTSLELENLRRFVDVEVASLLKNPLKRWLNPSCSLMGTAGTITTLAAIDQELHVYDPERINGYTLTRESVENIYNRLKGFSCPQRYAVPGLERGREDIILAGTIVVLGLMDALHFNEMTVSDSGLLEGVIIDNFC